MANFYVNCRYSYEAGTGCLNVTVGFTAVPWDSLANITWTVMTERGKENIMTEDIGASYIVTRRIDFKSHETRLGTKC